jgi:heme/copper-type cytochrome/quinol oxidase subunit 2
MSSNTHQERKVKNYLLLGLLLLIVIFVFSITLVKLRFAENDNKNTRIEEQKKVNEIKRNILNPKASDEKE